MGTFPLFPYAVLNLYFVSRTRVLYPKAMSGRALALCLWDGLPVQWDACAAQLRTLCTRLVRPCDFSFFLHVIVPLFITDRLGS